MVLIMYIVATNRTEYQLLSLNRLSEAVNKVTLLMRMQSLLSTVDSKNHNFEFISIIYINNKWMLKMSIHITILLERRIR